MYASLTGENADKLLQFKRWFWSIVEKMSMTERQDLVSLFSGTFQYTFVENYVKVFLLVFFFFFKESYLPGMI